MKPILWFLRYSNCLVVWILLGWVNPIAAQIQADDSLRNERSSIESTTINRRPASVIGGGARRGANLFHSFSNFNVRDGQQVYFSNPAGVDRILSRVTGNNSSQIRGTLGVLGNADLFLLNPNGIVFGPNARLDVRGSFMATTADRILFRNFSFGAVNPQAPPLLSISAPIGLQFGRAPGDIVNESYVESNEPLLDSNGNLVPIPPTFVDQFDLAVGLRVPAGKTLALVGGNLLLSGGELTAAGGQIELGSVTGPERVSLRQINRGWKLGYQDVQTFGNIQLLEVADVDATGAGGGEIRVWGDRVLISGSSLVRSNTLGREAGSGILIRASQLDVSDPGTRIVASTFSAGRGGTIRIRTNQLIVRDGAQIENNTSADGQGGNLFITANRAVNLLGVARDANGELNLQRFVDDNGNEILTPVGSGIFVRVNPGATGDGGNISITTNRLGIADGAQISSDTGGRGSAGAIRIRAAEIELTGVTLTAQGQPYTVEIGGNAAAFASSLSTFTSSGGEAGDMTIATRRLSLRDGAFIQTSTQGSGDAGNLRIHARDSIEVAGTTPGLAIPTSLTTFSGGIPEIRFGNPNATGAAGTIDITTRTLRVRDGAALTAGSLNPRSGPSDGNANAGNIQIRANAILMDDRARLTTATAAVSGGNVELTARNLLALQQDSDISASAGEGGNGGNVTINSANGFILAGATQDNDIVARAVRGRGGNINISALGTLGIQEQPETLGSNDIDASSEFGQAGTVVINSLIVDPTSGLAALPAAPVNTALAQGCQVQGGQSTAAFFNTGRGGLRSSPYEALSNETILDDVRLGPANTATPSDPQTSRSAAPLVEARGWRVDEQGKVVLTAEEPGANYQTYCHLR